MAIEPKRGCGFRKVGGIYLVSDGPGQSCDRLPFLLDVCPCCSAGFKPALGWTWVDVAKLFQGPHTHYANGDHNAFCDCAERGCPLCGNPASMGRAGLLWIGEKFYKSPGDFVKEGVALGFSRRIKAVPQKFKIGETWVLLAHKRTVPIIGKSIQKVNPSLAKMLPSYHPGIFFAWQPRRIEMIFKESDRGSEAVQNAEKRGITAVFVPDGDKDHQGNVHDDFEEEKKAKREAKKNAA